MQSILFRIILKRLFVTITWLSSTVRLIHNNVNKNSSIVGVVLMSFGLLFYLFSVIQPHTYSFFSLIDDGQTILNTAKIGECIHSFSCKEIQEIIVEKEFGRFRPLYWMIQASVQSVIGLNPTKLHEFRTYGLSLIIYILIFFVLKPFNKNVLGTFLATIIFFFNVSFTENITRLGPVEPYQLIFVVIAGILFTQRHELSKYFGNRSLFFFLIINSISAALIKETTLSLVGVIFIFSLFEKHQGLKKSLLISMMTIAIFLMIAIAYAKSDPSSADYSGGYQLTSQGMKQNIFVFKILLEQMFHPLFYFSIGLGIINHFLFSPNKKYLYHLLFWGLLTLAFIAIQIPWPYVLERYFLLPAFGLSVCFALIFMNFFHNFLLIINKTLSAHSVGKKATTLIILFLLINLIFMYLPRQLAKTANYTSWYRTYLQFEADQVHFLAHSNDAVSINATRSLNNWEVLYEIPIHLEQIYNKKKSVQLYNTTDLNTPLIFTSSSLERAVEIDKQKFNLIENRLYEAQQIDVNSFVENFKSKPLQALFNPPFQENPIKHSWQVWMAK